MFGKDFYLLPSQMEDSFGGNLRNWNSSMVAKLLMRALDGQNMCLDLSPAALFECAADVLPAPRWRGSLGFPGLGGASSNRRGSVFCPTPRQGEPLA